MRRNCLEILRKLCGKGHVVPRSFILQSGMLKKQGTRPLGGGGFADVWKGEYNGQVVALKFFAILFYQEAIIWKYLQHPNITPFLGVDATSSHLILVCAYMSEGTLTRYLERNPEANRLKLILKITEALVYLHGLDIAHGDLKGSNILINEVGSACLADFGLAKLSYQSMLHTISIKQRSLRWTAPELLDPEQFGVTRTLPTLNSDIFMFAFVIWEIFTGLVPYHKQVNDGAVIFAIMNDKRPDRPLRATALGLDNDVWEVTEQCWQKDRGQRPRISEVRPRLKAAFERFNSVGETQTPDTWPLQVD
ncbi:kinase-like protein [Obba rivulosa]|uniref:Kinase-like protein n=1 Tax=Obba rivulosa TaxID=1052685 RepID=A0A8E2AUK7_9APHY|nr:kinase-like protein [Obba rivulosa]